MAAHQAPLSLGFSRQEHWSGLPFPFPMQKSESEVAQSCPTLSDPMDCSPPGSSIHGIFQAWVLEWGAIAFSESNYTPIKINKSKKKTTNKVSRCFFKIIMNIDIVLLLLFCRIIGSRKWIFMLLSLKTKFSNWKKDKYKNNVDKNLHGLAIE